MSATERLAEARAARKAAERELKAEREIKAEKEAAYQAGLELARMKLTPEERKDILDRAERRFDSKYQMGNGH
jgi:hypothetical protein